MQGGECISLTLSGDRGVVGFFALLNKIIWTDLMETDPLNKKSPRTARSNPSLLHFLRLCLLSSATVVCARAKGQVIWHTVAGVGRP